MLPALLEPFNHKAANQLALLVLLDTSAMVQLFTPFHVQLAITALQVLLNLLLALLATLVLVQNFQQHLEQMGALFVRKVAIVLNLVFKLPLVLVMLDIIVLLDQSFQNQ